MMDRDEGPTQAEVAVLRAGLVAMMAMVIRSVPQAEQAGVIDNMKDMMANAAKADLAGEVDAVMAHVIGPPLQAFYALLDRATADPAFLSDLANDPD